MTVGELAAIASLLLNLGIVAVTATWGLGWAIRKIEVSVADAIAQHRESFDRRIIEAERRAGEGLAAVRQKTHELEIWARDTFTRRDSFLAMIKETKDAFQANADRLDKRLDRIDEKLDAIQRDNRL